MVTVCSKGPFQEFQIAKSEVFSFKMNFLDGKQANCKNDMFIHYRWTGNMAEAYLYLIHSVPRLGESHLVAGTNVKSFKDCQAPEPQFD